MPSTLVDRYSGLVCDLDGVVYRGPEAVEHAVAGLSGLELPVLYATNNASRPPGDVAAQLVELGLPVSEAQVVTSAQAGASVLADRLPRGATVLAVGGVGVGEALRDKGFRVLTTDEVRDAPAKRAEAVLQGYGAEVMVADLTEAAYAVSAGAIWVVTNTDATLPTNRGTAPGNGTLVDAVRRATGVEPTVVGKPEAPLYRLCAGRLGLDARQVLAVGDRLGTDIAGASEAGMDSVLVLTGVDSVTSVAGAQHPLRPTYVVEDLRSLGESYTAAWAEDGWWSCGPARLRLVNGRWDIADKGSAIESARAALGAVHQALDRGELDPAAARALLSDLDHWQ